MGEIGLSGKLAIEALRRFPAASKSAIARYLRKTEPDIYLSFEAARAAVQHHSGARGSNSRRRDDEYHREMTTAADAVRGLRLPKSLPREAKDPIRLEFTSALLMSDIHVPYHDMSALELAVRTGLDRSVDTVVLLGDILDFYACSSWEKDPRKRNLSVEVDRGRAFFAEMRRLFPDAKIYWKLGNHEERWERYLKMRAPDLIGLDFTSVESIYGCTELEINVVDRMQHIQLDKLNLVHGHEFGRSIFSPVNPARGLYMRAKATAICGHNHQTSSHVERSMNGSVVGTYSMGCLCDLRPEYAPYNKWNHGFAIVTHRPGDALSRVENFKIVNGELL